MVSLKGLTNISGRAYEDMQSLKKNLRTSCKVEEVIYRFIQATGGAGATVEVQEATGTTITYKSSAAQVTIRYSADAAGYRDKLCTLKYLTTAGVIKVVTASSDASDATTEVNIGSTDFYRMRPGYPQIEVTPGAGHTFILTDADCANVDGSGGDVWGMVEEGNYQSNHSRYFVPSADENGLGMYSYLCKIKARYPVVKDYTGSQESCTLRIICTPDDLGHAIHLDFLILAGEDFEFDMPIRLKAATDVTFQVIDDGATGGNLELEYHIVEATHN